MAKNGPKREPTNEDHDDIKDIPGVGRDDAGKLIQKNKKWYPWDIASKSKKHNMSSSIESINQIII